MSIKYFCDVCGREVVRKNMLYPAYVYRYENKHENKVAVGYAWTGDVCSECLTEIEYEVNMAKTQAIEKLKAVVS